MTANWIGLLCRGLFGKDRSGDMTKKLLITLPCNIRDLKAKLDNFDRCDVVVSQYDGEGDSLYVVSVMEEKENPNDTLECEHRIGVHCHKDELIDELPFICPFKDGKECRWFEPKKKDPVQAVNEFVQKLETAHEASKGSQLVFK